MGLFFRILCISAFLFSCSEEKRKQATVVNDKQKEFDIGSLTSKSTGEVYLSYSKMLEIHKKKMIGQLMPDFVTTTSLSIKSTKIIDITYDSVILLYTEKETRFPYAVIPDNLKELFGYNQDLVDVKTLLNKRKTHTLIDYTNPEKERLPLLAEKKVKKIQVEYLFFTCKPKKDNIFSITLHKVHHYSKTKAAVQFSFTGLLFQDGHSRNFREGSDLHKSKGLNLAGYVNNEVVLYKGFNNIYYLNERFAYESHLAQYKKVAIQIQEGTYTVPTHIIPPRRDR